MTTYNMLSEKTGTSISTVKAVSATMGIKHRITTMQLHALENVLNTIAEQRDNIIYTYSVTKDAAEEKAYNDWAEERKRI